MVSRVYVALDFASLEQASRLAKLLVEDVAGFKVGLQLFTAEGPRAVAEIADLGKPVFADLKLHDIPNTVEGAAAQVKRAGARWLTVHASGGPRMVEASVGGMDGGGVLGVTVLTAFGPDDLDAIGVTRTLGDQVTGLANLALAAGAEGIVSAPSEASAIRAAGIDAVLFTPGIRPQTSSHDDQKRIATPEAALAAGADYIVVGRPITRAGDPLAVVREIADTLAAYP